MSLEMFKDVALEELERKRRALMSFDNALKDVLYCSHIYRKNIKGNIYLYVKYRNDYSQKPKEVLIGRADGISESKIRQINEQAELWYKFQKQTKEVKQDISKLERIIKILE